MHFKINKLILKACLLSFHIKMIKIIIIERRFDNRKVKNYLIIKDGNNTRKRKFPQRNKDETFTERKY